MTTVHSKMAMAMGMAELSQSVRLLLEAQQSSSWGRTIRVSSREDQTISEHHLFCSIFLCFYVFILFVSFEFVFGSCLIYPWCYPWTSLGVSPIWCRAKMGNATERRPTKIESTLHAKRASQTTRNKKSRRANELNACSKIGHGTLDRLFSCRW